MTAIILPPVARVRTLIRILKTSAGEKEQEVVNDSLEEDEEEEAEEDKTFRLSDNEDDDEDEQGPELEREVQAELKELKGRVPWTFCLEMTKTLMKTTNVSCGHVCFFRMQPCFLIYP